MDFKVHGLAHCSGSRCDKIREPQCKAWTGAAGQKTPFLGQRETQIGFLFIYIYIKLYYNDHNLIGLLFLRIEVLQRLSSRKWQSVAVKSHSVM